MSDDHPRELTNEEFSSLMRPFEPFEARPVVAVGVSGGRDSLALVFLLHDWVRARHGQALALIVDHKLRPEAATEAAATAALLARHGIAADVLAWGGAKPVTGLQEAARSARYKLLFEACRRHGILHLLVAHHADDQAETIAMRAARGSGADGLAGMAPQIEHRHGRLLRPLLPIRRARLTATLRARKIDWIDDPSNTDLRFERARLRRGGELPPAEPERAAIREGRERRLADAALDVVDIDPAGAVALDQANFARLGRAEAAHLLGHVVQAIGERPYPTRRERLERAVMRLSRISDGGRPGKSQDFTLSRCQLTLRWDREEQRLRWIVRPENGRKDGQSWGKPLVPAVFFACGVHRTPHLDMKPQ